MNIKPIRTERDWGRAMKEIDRLMDAAPGTEEGDRLEVLVALVADWEARHHAIEAPDALSAIVFAMEQRGLTRRDLEPMIGSRARVSEVMSGKRKLTLPMIRKLNSALNIPAEVLIQEPAA